MPPPPQNMLQDLKNWIEDIPAVTRYLVVSTFALSIGCMVGIATPGQLILDIPPIKENLQVYRLLTCHLLSGGQGLIWHLYMLYTNSRHLETSHFATRPGDYAFGVLLIIATLDVLGWYFQFIVLTEAFGMAITTLYSLIEGDKEVTFMFGARFKAKYLPWGLVMGGDYPIPLSGIAVGYAFHYLDVTYPETHAGRRILVAPAFIKNWYPENMRVQGMTGPVHQGPAPRRNTGWGRGNRLG